MDDESRDNETESSDNDTESDDDSIRFSFQTSSSNKRVAFYFWRNRWRYVLVPMLIFSAIGWFMTPEDTSSGDYTLLDRFKAAAFIGLALAGLVAWAIANAYARAIGKWFWAIAMLVMPPLAIVFYFYQSDVEKQGRFKLVVQRIIALVDSYVWCNRWRWVLFFSACTAIAHLIFVNSWSASPSLRSIAGAVVLSVLASSIIATLIAMIISLFKASANRKWVWVIAIVVMPLFAFGFFYYGMRPCKASPNIK